MLRFVAFIHLHSPSARMTSLIAKLRRFRFSLRTLFVVVTLIAVWLGWTLWRLRQREKVYLYLTSSAHFSHAFVMRPDELPLAPWKRLPVTWRLLGAKPLSLTKLQRDRFSERDQRQIQSLFPEALVALE
jgi:hypothetical protein